MNMQRFAPYLGIFALLFFGALALTFFGDRAIQRLPAVETGISSSTLSEIPAFVPPAVSLPTLKSPSATSSTGTATIPKKVVPPAKKSAPAPVAATPTTTKAASAPAPLTSSGNIGLDAAASALRNALVNIICYAPIGSNLHSISGSGVVIDPKGIILTNAHVAQYFLLADRGVSCTIRSGSPAADKYGGALVYISPLWISTNASVITQVSPSGTGEYDFALVAVTKSVTATPLPAAFPFLSMAQLPPAAGTPIVIASYGAQFLEANQVQSALFPTVVFGSIKDIFTFVTNTIDVLALGGSAAAQEGSSGGGVADASGSLVGTITTSTIEGATDTRSLDAITASYIRAEYASETGNTLDSLLTEPTQASISDFAAKMPALEAVLTAQLH